MEASAATTPAASGSPHRFVPARLLRVATDERLVALVRQGSQPAFEVIYDRHHRDILAFCRHMLASREEAEDALQHTFMAAYRDLVGSEKDIQLRAWLYAIARNRCLTVLRARREKPVDELEDIPTEGLAAEVERRQDLQQMLRDLAALPEDQRAALVLSEIGDLSHDDVAAVIGCRREKVKALVFQARSSLHASRDARDTDCADVRHQLSTLRGGALRRTSLRRHLKECDGCRAFRGEVDRQRRAMAALLPVVPTLGLKGQILAAVFGGNAAAGAAGVAATAGGAAAGMGAAGTGATAAGSGGAAFVAKALIVSVAAVGGAAGVKSIASSDADPGNAKKGAVERSQDQAPGSGGSKRDDSGSGGNGGGTLPAALALPIAATGDDDEDKPKKTRKRKTARGKELARTRGKGRKHGLNGTQPGHADDPAGEDDEASGGRKLGHAKTKKPKKPKKAKRNRGRALGHSKTKTKVHGKQKADARPVKTPKPQPTVTPVPKPKPKPKPVRTAEPSPEATIVPTIAPSVDDGDEDHDDDAQGEDEAGLESGKKPLKTP